MENTNIVPEFLFMSPSINLTSAFFCQHPYLVARKLSMFS